jgi:hypothetical protein
MVKFKGINKNHKCKTHGGATQAIQYPKDYYNLRRYKIKRNLR